MFYYAAPMYQVNKLVVLHPVLGYRHTNTYFYYFTHNKFRTPVILKKFYEGLWDHIDICVCESLWVYGPNNFWTPEPIFIKLLMYNMSPKAVLTAYFINPSWVLPNWSLLSYWGNNFNITWTAEPISCNLVCVSCHLRQSQRHTS
jgi:hypothetical protein